ncbi:MAG: class I fructose-bisphosphate aldolase [Pseudomonadota bacterium]
MSAMMETTIQQMAARGKGILAADESTGTIKKRFDSIGIENTEENRRAYRELLFTTDNLADYICGVICFEETLDQSTKDGHNFTILLQEKGMVPGIKVDKGLIPLVNGKDEKTTQGLDGLPDRLAEYKAKGARFAKWRVVYNIDTRKPSHLAIMTNAELLARYAAICQSLEIVPIVEPELLMDGDHDIERCRFVSEMTFRQVFAALARHHVVLEHMILKPSMIISGQNCATQANVDTVASETIKVLLRTVPAAVPSINFLSGGQSAELATQHLNRMNALFPHLPWNLSFSYGRALQAPCLAAWKGNSANIAAAQKALFERAKLNSAACLGEYSESLESAVA